MRPDGYRGNSLLLDANQTVDPELTKVITALNLGSAATGLVSLSGEGLLNLRAGNQYRKVKKLVDVAKTTRSADEIETALDAVASAISNLEPTTIFYIARSEKRGDALRGLLRREISELNNLGTASPAVVSRVQQAQALIYESTDAYRRLKDIGVAEDNIKLALDNLSFNLFREYTDDLVANNQLINFFNTKNKIKSWSVLPISERKKIDWLNSTSRWIELDVSAIKTNETTVFTASNGFEFARIENGSLYYINPGYGGDILTRNDRVTTVLGRFKDNDTPASHGTWIYLDCDGGLTNGIISRVVSGTPPNRSIAFLDLPANDYNLLINAHIRDAIQANPEFDGNLSNLNLITNQNPWTEVEDIIRTSILPSANSTTINDILSVGRTNGNDDFWNTYNYTFLESAFERGDDIRLVSDPTPGSPTRTGTYAKELDAIEGATGLMNRYDYIYNNTTKTFEKQ